MSYSKIFWIFYTSIKFFSKSKLSVMFFHSTKLPQSPLATIMSLHIRVCLGVFMSLSQDPDGWDLETGYLCNLYTCKICNCRIYKSLINKSKSQRVKTVVTSRVTRIHPKVHKYQNKCVIGQHRSDDLSPSFSSDDKLSYHLMRLFEQYF